MKSFVYTVVAATIAASSAAANTTDASTSGTVAAATDMCEFYNVTDGIMEYSPSRMAENGVSPIGGVWVTGEPAYISIRHRGASQLMLEATNQLIGGNGPYKVQVDYSPYENQVKFMAGETMNLLPGGTVGRTVVLGSSSGNWSDNDLRSRYGAVLDRQAGSEWTPFEPYSSFYGYGDGMSNAAEDRIVWNLDDDGQEYNVNLAIDGVAWMVDQNTGAPAHDRDNQYGMTYSNYYIEHNVTCLQ